MKKLAGAVLLALFCALAGNAQGIQYNHLPGDCGCYTPSTEGLSGATKMVATDSEVDLEKVIILANRVEMIMVPGWNPVQARLGAWTSRAKGSMLYESSRYYFLDSEGRLHLEASIPDGATGNFFFTLAEGNRTVWEAQITGVTMNYLDNRYLVAKVNGTKFDFKWEPVYG